MNKGRITGIVIVIGLVALLMLGLQVVLGSKVRDSMEERWPTAEPLETRIQAMLISSQDLPSGWHLWGVETQDEPGAEARRITYLGTSDPDNGWVKVTQRLAVYPSPEAATEAYSGWVDRWIPPAHADDWISPPGLEFASQADDMVLACLEGYVAGEHHFACIAIGRYGETVVVLLANVFDEQRLTMEDFQALLEAMDQRITSRTGTQASRQQTATTRET